MSKTCFEPRVLVRESDTGCQWGGGGGGNAAGWSGDAGARSDAGEAREGARQRLREDLQIVRLPLLLPPAPLPPPLHPDAAQSRCRVAGSLELRNLLTTIETNELHEMKTQINLGCEFYMQATMCPYPPPP
eukprot:COSAG04_NODE_6762_length_1261_cov_23.075731_1_plen_130_part_10